MTAVFKQFKDSPSLRQQLLRAFFVTAIIPLLLIGGSSYYAIYSILDNNVDQGIQERLGQVQERLEGMFFNLSYVTQQLAFSGQIGENLNTFLHPESAYDSIQASQQIHNDMALINYTNPNIGQMLYYFPKKQGSGKIQFPLLEVEEDFDPRKLPLFTQYRGTDYYGPHLTQYKNNSTNMVFSILRRVDVTSADSCNCFIYAETNLRLLTELLSANQYGMPVKHMILDRRNQIVFSEDEIDYPTGSIYPHAIQTGKPLVTSDTYYFSSKSKFGWSIVVSLSRSQRDQDINEWLTRFLWIGLVTLTVGLYIAWLVWRKIYRPLVVLNKQIKRMTSSHFQSEVALTQVQEFDAVLLQFRSMQHHISELLHEIELKEKRKMDLEVEKLLYQINPHFLHNTLDTIRWVAQLNGQPDIEKLVRSLAKVLNYNLGKQGSLSELRDEIEAMDNYVTLQKMRYDFEFDIRIEVDGNLLDIQVPRFILQPLIENALYHGLDDEGIIVVRVSMQPENPDMILLEVIDNGAGMDPVKIEALLRGERGEQQRSGFGIGLQYVIRIIQAQENEGASIHIYNNEERGMTVSLRIPIIQGRVLA